MKRYKNWMAVILTMILMVTGTISPALAAEFPTETEELVSAAEFYAEEITDAAAIPDVPDIEEEADIPAEASRHETDVQSEDGRSEYGTAYPSYGAFQ